MNYYDLVVSKTPDIYIPYNDGTNADVMGAGLILNDTNQLNPYYDWGGKAHGLRCKRIGLSGAGTYDYRVYRKSTATVGATAYYFHAEFWIYIPSPRVTTDVANLLTITYNTYTQPSYIRMNADGKLVFITQRVTGTQDNNFFSTDPIPTDQWVHIAVQYDLGIKRIWFNGVINSIGDTGFPNGMAANVTEASYTPTSIYFDELAVWIGDTTTKPANFPTEADVLERATFPRTRTRLWWAPFGYWVMSGDERYWNGTQWISMQNLPYKVWNGTDWVEVPRI